MFTPEQNEKLAAYYKQIEGLRLSPTANASLRDTVHEIRRYLDNIGGYSVTTDGLKQDIIMIDRNINLDYKPGTQGSKYFEQCKKDVLWTIRMFK